jgi:hypothetical protein
LHQYAVFDILEGAIIIDSHPHQGGIVMALAKEQMSRIIEEQPDDSSYDEILRELAFARMIERGLEDSKANRIISDEEMRNRIKTWRK